MTRAKVRDHHERISLLSYAHAGDLATMPMSDLLCVAASRSAWSEEPSDGPPALRDLHRLGVHLIAIDERRAVLALYGLNVNTPDENVAAWCAEAITEARAAYEHGRGHVPYDVARVRRATLQTITEAAALHLRAVKALDALRSARASTTDNAPLDAISPITVADADFGPLFGKREP